MTELKKPEHRGLGMHIGDIWAGAQTWADDIVILAADKDLKAAREKMAALMVVANTWAAENGVTFSTDATEGEGKGKSKVVTFGASTPARYKWALGTNARSFKYLGTTINDKLTWNEHVIDRIGAGGSKLWAVRRLARNNGIAVEVCAERWRSTVPPTVLHGMAATNMTHNWKALEAEYGAGAKACLGMHRLASGHIACNEMGWMPPQAHVEVLQCMQLWRIQHVAPARARAIHRYIATSGVVSPGGRQCTAPWHTHISALVEETVGAGAEHTCDTMSKRAWRELVTQRVAAKYRRHWRGGIADKLAVVPSHGPEDYIGKRVSAPSSMFGEHEEWGAKHFDGTVQSYCATSGRWGVDFPSVDARARRLMDKSDMRKYGPQDMRLRTTKDTDGPDWHLTEYAATALPGRAWYFSDPDCSPQRQRWHARSRAGCGLAATYAKAADSKFRACTCSAAVETMHHVYMECPHYASARTALVAAMDVWCATMQSQDEDRRAYSRSEALTWIHSNTGAHTWCPAHGALRQAAWVFWKETRQHKEVLGEDDGAPGPLPTPTGPTFGPSPQHAQLATAVAL
jgi:hypothetical protein